MKEKSKFLNQKTPLYSTRTHPGCIEFKLRLQMQEIERQKAEQHNKKFLSLTKSRIKWISDAWVAQVDRIAENLLPESPFPSSF